MFSSGVRKLLLMGALALTFAVTIAISEGISSSGFGSSSNSGGPSPSGSPAYDRKFLTQEFKRAQENELKAFEKKEKAEASAMATGQKARRNDFEKTERIAREKFFTDPHTGAEKRAYIKAMLARREALKKSQADERAQYQHDAEERLEALVDDQQRKRGEFEDALKHGERPQDALWPQPGIMSEPSPNR